MQENARTTGGPSPGYQFFILALSLYALAVVAAQMTIALDPRMEAIFDSADYIVCLVFFVDFGISLWRAPDRRKYFLTWGWLDLLSSIPVIDAARWGRVARIARVLRVLRAFRAARVIASTALQQRAQNTVLAAALLALLLIVFCSIAVLHFERAPDSNIRTADDAMWWAFTTITTVGYGDRFPVTPAGRIVATILMVGGVGVFGSLSAVLAAWMLRPQANEEESEIAELRDDIKALRSALERQDRP